MWKLSRKILSVSIGYRKGMKSFKEFFDRRMEERQAGHRKNTRDLQLYTWIGEQPHDLFHFWRANN